jgi:precorrin-6B methylase 2
MNKLFFTVYRVLVPKPVRARILKKNLRKKILTYYSSLPEIDVNDEQKEVLKYLENNPVTIFPYAFFQKYSPEKIKVQFDHTNGMPYVMQEGKKLYFRKRWTILNKRRTVKRIQRAYADLSREQDPESPHRYLSSRFDPGESDVVADIGAAEGNFSLSLIEKVKKIYLIEYNREWIKALEQTFDPWKDKVEIISRYVSDCDDEKHISLNALLKSHKDITFLKIDVDGNEQRVLNGAKEILEAGIHLKIALCTYHKNNDEKEFTATFLKSGFTVTPSKGYMIHYYDKKMRAPYLRRGLIRAER